MINYAVEILENLININTTVSNCNEIEAAKYINKELLKLGIKSTIYEPYKGKASIVAVINGIYEENVVLYSHLDTEDYMPERGWKVRPDATTKVNGNIFGRGALDCKGLTAVWMSVIKKILDLNTIPKKTIMFVAGCDEESGGEKGLKWLMDNTKLFKKTALVISEGGGFSLKSGETTYFTVQVGEREKIVFKKNESIYDYLLNKQVQNMSLNLEKGLISKLYYERNINYLNKLKVTQNDHIKRISTEQFNDIIIEKKEDKIIVYKLPYLDTDYLFPALFENYEIIEKVETGWIRNDSMYLNIIEKELCELNTSYKMLPFITPGYSDNRYFRLKGIETLGFFPIDYNNKISGIHGVNEYISTDSIKLSSKLLFRIIKNIAF